MLEVFHLDVVKSGVARVAVGPTCRSRLLQLLGLHACVWEWRGHERQARETEQATD
jgi:hypothetical protein